MKMKVMVFLMAVILSAALPGCTAGATGKQVPTETEAEEASDKETVNESIEGTEENTKTEERELQEEETMKMTIGGARVNVAWEKNDSVRALMDLCREKPLTVEMSMYGGFEQVGSLGKRLPSNDTYTTTASGDIVLYSSNQIVVFYGSNAWEYTRLGHITDRDEAGMRDLLSGGDVTITISMED